MKYRALVFTLVIVALLPFLSGTDFKSALPLLNLIPALVTVWIMDKWMQNRLGRHQANAAMMMLLSTIIVIANIFASSLDMLMCMFITLSLYEFCQLYRNTKGGRDLKEKINSHEARKFRTNALLLPLFVFLGLFTKGALGFLIPVLSIIVFLVSEKELRIGRYLGWRFWGTLILLSALWAAGAYIQAGKESLCNLLQHQTLGGFMKASSAKPFWYYAANCWHAFLPWCLFIFTAIVLGFTKRLIWEIETKLFSSILLSTLVYLSLIGSKFEVYMLYTAPFAVYLAIILSAYLGNSRLLKISIAVPAVIFILIFASSVFAHKLAGWLAPEITLPKL